MEIFKAASAHYDAVIHQNTEHLQTRPVEHTEIDANAAKQETSEINNEKIEQEISKEKLDEAVKKLNEQMEDMRTDIKFGYNDKLGTMYVDVVAGKTGKVIRTIPSVEVMRLSESMKEAVGIIFDKKS